MTDEEFYQRCAEILGMAHDGVRPMRSYINRWNNRAPGRGRFPGCGIIRAFGDNIQIAIHTPFALQTNVEGRQAALDLLAARIISQEDS